MAIQLFSWLLWISLFHVFRVSAQCLNDQRSSLLQLNSSLSSLNWDATVDCCKWDGVGCDESGYVIILELDQRGISGDLENAHGLFGLRYLERLNLAWNNFSSSQIPNGLGNLTRLAYLNLSNSGLGGQVPMELSELRSLVSLDLSSQFQGSEGTLPLTLETPDLRILGRNLTRLTELYLDGVNISSHGNNWCQSMSSSLPNLRTLSLRGCGLSGPLHPSLLHLQYLSVLRLDRNNLSTTVPVFLADFSILTTLSMAFCSLRGTFPDMIFRMPTLQNLELSFNANLGGTITLFPHNGSLRSIVLSYTNFSGSLPDSISNLSMLSRIELSNCSFSGPIPSTIGNLTELVYVDFSYNSFTGSVPCFHMSKKLTYLDLSRNILTGFLSPTHFEGLLNLRDIYIGYNTLTGTIPESLFALPSLQKLGLSNNKFSGQVAFSTCNSSKLDTVDLSRNQLEGSIPEAFFNLEQLIVLLLSDNSFNGTLDLAKIQKLPNLARLELGYNHLSIYASSSNSSPSQFPRLNRLNLASCNLSSFPEFLRNQSVLAFLDLSSNHINGEIPSWIWEIGKGELLLLNLSLNLLVDIQRPFNMPQSLSVLDLHLNRIHGELPIPPEQILYVDYSNNKFQQSIPYYIGDSLTYAIFFSVASNRLNGTIPPSLCNATSLQILDLSGNYLSGSLPPCLVENMTSLGVLNLGKNKFNGDIPNSFSVECSLRTLDLSRNYLGGKMPSSLANCRSLELVNLGNNKIHDGFPCMLNHLPALHVLVLRNNQFHGDLSCCGTNESWQNLQIIDVAVNNFNGYLPVRCISIWRGMSLGADAMLHSNHLQFKFLEMSNFYYRDTVAVTTKGMELELVKILNIFTSIDFSSNNFQGQIPGMIGDLNALYTLNLSHNNLNGTIPKSIGNLTQLGSLDVSNNLLTEWIPKELSSLTFLSFLNVSYNNLSGMIPQGSQLQTFTSSSYEGNIGLCGFPLSVSCNPPAAPAAMPARHSSNHEFGWLFIFVASGYGVGVALVISAFVLFPSESNRRLDHAMRTCINF